jgi:hypothetical protein
VDKAVTGTVASIVVSLMEIRQKIDAYMTLHDGTGTAWVTVVKERRESLPLEGRHKVCPWTFLCHRGDDEDEETNRGHGDESDHKCGQNTRKV